MSKLFQQRWEAAKALFERLQNVPDDYQIWYDGTVIHKKNIVIGKETIVVWINSNFMETWFEYDKDWDHGSYTRITEFEKLVRDSFKVVKVLEGW